MNIRAARVATDHAARRCSCGQKHRPDGGHDGPHDVLGRHLEQRRALHVDVRNQIEGDVDAARLGRDSIGLCFTRTLGKSDR
jgi:hypothetical protein